MFIDSFPDYKQFNETKYHMRTAPDGLSDSLNGIIYRYCDERVGLKSIVNELRSFIPEAPTGNWTGDWLKADLSDALYKLAKGKFHRFMDAIESVIKIFVKASGRFIIREFNEVFDDSEFGYHLEMDAEGFIDTIKWVAREENPTIVENIDETVKLVEDICEQTVHHLRQIKKNLEDGTARSRKDAVRDALSGMESLLKELTSTNDIKDAVSKLRTDGEWGPNEIVKDGLSIWDRLHHRNPDIRHGDPVISDLPEDEALYWIDRIIIYIIYITRRKKALQ